MISSLFLKIFFVRLLLLLPGHAYCAFGFDIILNMFDAQILHKCIFLLSLSIKVSISISAINHVIYLPNTSISLIDFSTFCTDDEELLEFK